MFAGELKSIQEAEAKADEIMRQAKLDAKKILQEGKEAAEKILSESELEADEILAAHARAGNQKADAVYQDILEETRQKCSEIRDKAAGGYENATLMISERIVRNSVNS